jgi:nicotinate phosphoribosyltransferase
LREQTGPPDWEPLLAPVMVGGRRLRQADPAQDVRSARGRLDTDLAWLPRSARRLDDPQPVVATISPQLAALRERLTGQLMTSPVAARPG